MHPRILRFDTEVPSCGYRWWYLDALSDDGAQALTIILFIGSVFSPYYAWARRRGETDPNDHCAFNVALYGARHSRWAMTERGRSQMRRNARALVINASRADWNGACLEIQIDERCAPFPRRLVGAVRVWPEVLLDEEFAIDEAARHRWIPIAPRARVEVDFSAEHRWRGIAYLDSNAGAEPLENAFERWNWSRAHMGQETAVLYDIVERNGASRSLALRFDANGLAHAFNPPPACELARTGWRMRREARSDCSTPARLLRTLEDAPFYSRSIVETHLAGKRATAIHESLSLARFRSPLVQAMLPFRMPRIAGGRRNALRP